MVGDGTVNKDGLQSIDLLREMAKASKAEQYLLLAIINGVSYKNGYNPVVKVIGDTSTHKQYIITGYKELHNKGLVKRIKKSHYMINPNALIPLDYDEAIELWDSLP